MQLYTVGLHELHPDGTEVRDQFDQAIQTYNNIDIMSNARLFTGFTFTARRGNIEELFRSEKSRQDPMRIEVDLHDFSPKTSLDGNWIGDRYPLCVDLPKKGFLSVGATYQFRAGSSLPRNHHHPPHWDTDESIKRFVLSKDSGLYSKLCNPGEDGECNFANTITLDANLPCTEKECRVDTLEVVQVAPGTFYEYVRRPCVDLSFYPNPKKVITGYAPWVRYVGRQHTHAMCADPRLPLASRSCCNEGTTRRSEFNFELEYHGERVRQETILEQCAAVQIDHNTTGTVCDPVAIKADNPLVNTRPIYNLPYPSRNSFFWTEASCTQLVQVREDGFVSIVHEPDVNPFFYDQTVPYVDKFNVNYFAVPWQKEEMTFKEIYPSLLENDCGHGACSITEDGLW